MAVWLLILVGSINSVFMNSYQLHIIGAWLHACGYTISEHQLNLELLSHPDYPSLNAITESLNRMGMEATAAKVEKSLLPDLEGSFLAYLNGNGLPVLVLVKDLRCTDSIVSIVVDKDKQMQLSREEFIGQWNGIVVVVDEGQKSLADRFNSIKKFAPVMLLAVILISCFLIGEVGIWTSANFLLSFVGLAVCSIIVAHELGSSVASTFCTEGRRTSCNAVLNSKAAKLPFGIGLSDVGIVYFASNILYWLVASFNGLISTSVSVAALFSLLAIPFTLFSITYQGLVVKKFCPLCLSVVTVLWLQAASLIPYAGAIPLGLTLKNLALFVGLAVSLILLWGMLKPLLKLPRQNRELLQESVTFRRSYHLFLPWFSQAQPLELGNIPELQLGNPKAPLKLLAISNPMCEPCAAAHHVYVTLMEKYPGQLHLSIRFFVPLENRNDPRLLVAARLMELSAELCEEELSVAVNQWYDIRDYRAWVKEWGMPHKANSEAALIAQKGWCLSNGLDQTPTLLLNGRVVPHYYQAADLENFVAPLLAQLETHFPNDFAYEGALN